MYYKPDIRKVVASERNDIERPAKTPNTQDVLSGQTDVANTCQRLQVRLGRKMRFDRVPKVISRFMIRWAGVA